MESQLHGLPLSMMTGCHRRACLGKARTQPLYHQQVGTDTRIRPGVKFHEAMSVERQRSERMAWHDDVARLARKHSKTADRGLHLWTSTPVL
jgi:hypothetical protein